MNVIILITLTMLLASGTAVANKAESRNEILQLTTQTGSLEGTLLLPGDTFTGKVVLLLSGSGPTDRDGNQPMMMNNSLKMVAEHLAKAGIASLRFDKRGIGASAGAMIPEVDLRFHHFVDDAAGWIRLLQEDDRFDEVIVAGHSEGSLIGMIAARTSGASAFISIAGAGRGLDVVIRSQLQAQPSFVQDAAIPILDRLLEGESVESVPPMLYALFRPSVQPYLTSLFAHHPATEIAKLGIPVLIVQGSTDIQVTVEDAELLHAASQSSELHLIGGMNHVLKTASSDMAEQLATYSNPDLPLHPDLMPAILDFIRALP